MMLKLECSRGFTRSLPGSVPTTSLPILRRKPVCIQNSSACKLSFNGPRLHETKFSAPLRRRLMVVNSASSAAVPMQPPATPAAPSQAIKIVPAMIAIGVGVLVRYAIPIPAGLTPQAWDLFAIFLSTITGLVLGPLPVGAWAFMALTVVVATGTLTFKQALSAMTSEVIWLIVLSFFFAKAFDKCGLGERIANIFVVAFGKSTLGVAMGLMLAETAISPALPSTTARAGGIFMPIIKFLSKNQGSEPENGRRKMGAYLVQSQFHCSNHNSALFLTAAAQNLLCLKMAAELGVVVPDPWMTWFLGAVAPATVALVVTPLVLYYIFPPEVKSTPEAPQLAKESLEKMGPMSKNQVITLVTLLGAVVLWMFGDGLGIPAVLAAMLGVCVLLATGVLTWDDCLSHKSAWDTLTWFAILISMSSGLNELNVITTFSDMVGSALTSMNMSWQSVFILLHAAFFWIHYLFASQTAHICSLYTAFVAMMMAAGVPPMLAALSLGYNGNLTGTVTHFASGQAAVYYGSGYTTLNEVFKYGFIMGVLTLVIWLGVGMPWWKLLGWW